MLVHIGQILAAFRTLALDVGGNDLIEVEGRGDQVLGRALGVGVAGQIEM